MIAMTLLGACGMVGSEHGACPPVVEYSVDEQQRAAIEVEALPPSAVIMNMLTDYHVLRRQAHACWVK